MHSSGCCHGCAMMLKFLVSRISAVFVLHASSSDRYVVDISRCCLCHSTLCLYIDISVNFKLSSFSLLWSNISLFVCPNWREFSILFNTPLVTLQSAKTCSTVSSFILQNLHLYTSIFLLINFSIPHLNLFRPKLYPSSSIL